MLNKKVDQLFVELLLLQSKQTGSQSFSFPTVTPYNNTEIEIHWMIKTQTEMKPTKSKSRWNLISIFAHFSQQHLKMNDLALQIIDVEYMSTTINKRLIFWLSRNEWKRTERFDSFLKKNIYGGTGILFLKESQSSFHRSTYEKIWISSLHEWYQQIHFSFLTLMKDQISLEKVVYGLPWGLYILNLKGSKIVLL